MGRLAESDLVFFLGYTDRAWIGLGGSYRHIIGSQYVAPVGAYVGASHFYEMMDRLRKHAPNEIRHLLDYNTEESQAAWSLILGTERIDPFVRLPTQNLQFLAKTLQQTHLSPSIHSFDFKRIFSYAILGTPIYVALAD